VYSAYLTDKLHNFADINMPMLLHVRQHQYFIVNVQKTVLECISVTCLRVCKLDY